ncbi:MAG: N-acetylneuraminate synthase [Paenibacillaceae bacterium]|nr:N-acetylneuraminate synthase [Paenibacillaceae bacterium]
MSRTYVIAEAGVNHNGSLDLAKRLIEAAREAGADAVKFQTFNTNKLLNRDAPKAAYQTETTDAAESQFDMIKKLELSMEAHRELVAHCLRCGIQFLSTPFDEDSVRLLTEALDVPAVKISSGDLTNAPLLLQVAQTGKPMILSTGMATLGEVEAALGVVAFGYLREPGGTPGTAAFRQAYGSAQGQALLREKVALLHCTTEYPTPFDEVHLNNMTTLAGAFGLKVGYSDHTMGITVPIAAVALGAQVIEKHFTLDRQLPGPDHRASLEPDELKRMVQAIRETEAALGSFRKTPTESERKNMPVARKSIVAAEPIEAGETLTAHNLTVKRPGDGISPLHYFDLLGTRANGAYRTDEPIKR